MKDILLPANIAEIFETEWRNTPESIGYAIAEEEVNRLVCLYTVRTGVGSSTEVEEQRLEILAKLIDLDKRFPSTKILPAHSHIIEGCSPRDNRTLKTLMKLGFPYALIIAPSSIDGYFTGTDEKINKVKTEIAILDTIPAKYYEIIHRHTSYMKKLRIT